MAKISKEKSKKYDFSNITDIPLGDHIEVVDRTGETKTVKVVDRAESSSVLAYLVGIDLDDWKQYYEHNYGNILIKLENNQDAKTVRYLCRIRSCFMKYFLEIDEALVYLQNIDANPKFHQDEIAQLKRWGVPIIITNSRAEDYVAHISQLITKYIDSCKSFFQLSLKYDYIRKLFIIPNRKEAYIEEYRKFKGHRSLYPYQCYLYWEPGDYGYIFRDDKVLFDIVYGQNNDVFYEGYKLRNASQSTKHTIYEFVGKAHQIEIVVDCENSDPFKLYSFLKSLDDESRTRISKIVLFDDTHTTIGWELLEQFTTISVDYRMVERVTENKSLVDMEMAVGVTKAYTTENIDSFLLCSSDSDFWGLISSLPEARYLVMYEYTKCGADIKDAWSRNGILNYSLDDFYSDKDNDLRVAVLLHVLQDEAADLIGEEPMEFAKKVYRDAYIQADRDEIRDFCENYVMKLSLKLDDEGRFCLAL